MMITETAGHITKLEKNYAPGFSPRSAESRRRSRKSQRGQSLAEFAISMPILILIFFGMVDLGRAFFTLVSLDSVISEGANWAAAYPNCIASASNATDASQVPPECKGTNSIIGRMLNESTNLDLSHVIATSVTPVTANPGDVITISISYRLDMITPVIQAITQSIVLTAQGQEVVRSTGSPSSTGVPLPNNGGVVPTRPVLDAAQVSTPPGTGLPPNVTCNGGVATVSWTAVSASGYHVFLGQVSRPYPAPIPGPSGTLAAGPVGSTMTWTWSFGPAGGSQPFTFTSYNLVGATMTDSDPTWVIPVSCSAIQPSILTPQPSGWWCPDATHAEFQWTMPTPVDTAVAGYGIGYFVAPSGHTFIGPLTGNPALYAFSPPPPSPDQTASYAITALNSSNAPIGNWSAPVSINCLAGTGLSGNYYTYVPGSGQWFTTLKLTRTDPTVNFDWGSGSPDPSIPIDYYSAEWTGKVQALCSDTYTFYTDSDDGVRLWVNGTLLIDNWGVHAVVQNTGTIVLEKGKRYSITLDFYENTGQAVIKLSWSSTIPGCPGPTKTIIPNTQLYP